MRTGLFFGSFNPIHVGHLILANAVLEHAELDEVWFVVSPQNPFKEKASLLPDHERLEMVRRAVADHPRLQACDAELHLPTPSYTCVTLAHLAERHPDREFALIMGSDNLEGFPRWRNAEEILAHYRLLVYPRLGHLEASLIRHPQVCVMEGLPLLEISSTYIRQELASGRSAAYTLLPVVAKYINEKQHYKNL